MYHPMGLAHALFSGRLDEQGAFFGIGFFFFAHGIHLLISACAIRKETMHAKKSLFPHIKANSFNFPDAILACGGIL